MKILLSFLFAVWIVFSFSVSSYAAWVLYDDFNSGQIDPQKWGIDDSSAIITVESGRVKFVHLDERPNDSSWLHMNQNRETIMGIRTTITVESCTGDVRARVVGYAGKIGENYIFSNIQLKANEQIIYSSTGLEGPPPNYTWFGSLFWAQYQQPVVVLGNTLILTIMFENDKITYEVDGLGKITHKYSIPVSPTDDFWRALGTRSSNGEGPCTVYFDDVYVFRP